MTDEPRAGCKPWQELTTDLDGRRRRRSIRRLDEPEFPGFANVYESPGEAEPSDDDPDAAA